MPAAVRRLAFCVLLPAVLVPGLGADELPVPSSNLVAVQDGELPIILSAPHGGTKAVLKVPPRQGKGMKKGGAGFFAGRDVGTEELAYALSDAIKKKTGKKPYYVVAKFHRKYIDANRPPDIAYEDANAKPVYDAYRRTLAKYCMDVKKTYGRGLLLDLHGQGAIKDSIIRGTKDGKTVALLVRRSGEQAQTGPKSFFGLLAARGFKVYPPDLSGKEYPSLNGGNIVQTYGGEKYGIDAIQLEFGSIYRVADKRKEVAANVADAIAEFFKRYLVDKK